MLTDGEVLIAIEIEAGQTQPDINVGKYWLLYEKYKQYKKIILYQVYTPSFDSYGWRKKLGEFYVTKMPDSVPIEYNQLDYRSAKDYKQVLTELKKMIGERIRKEFPQ